MELKIFSQNRYDINSYLLYDTEEKKAYVIDPGLNGKAILKFLEQNELTLESILLTHGHGDHIAELFMLLEKYPAKVYANEEEKILLGNADKNHSTLMTGIAVELEADFYVGEGDSIQIGKETLNVVHTPGHTKGGVCYYNDRELFTGDTLFRGSIGRTDLYGGNYDEILNSLVRLAKLNPELTVYPGHGPKSTLAREIATNPFYRGLL